MTQVGWALLAVVTVLAGCVTAYDPSTTSRLGLETRAEELGVRDATPSAPRKKWFSRWHQPRLEEATAAAQARPAPGAAPKPPQPALSGGATIPDTPAGRQLAWWISVLRGGNTQDLETHFNAEFLKAVPGAQVRQIGRQWRSDELANGPVELVRIEDEPGPDRLIALIRGQTTDRYTRIRLGVDDAGLIRMLWLGPVLGVKRGDIVNWAKLDERLKQLPGRLSIAAFELSADGPAREVHLYGADTGLAIGSTFKLYILGALAEEIAAGRITWDEPLAIKDDLKSLPSGKLQLELEGAEFPISHYAELMISTSDNTAADHLFARVGRGAIEAYMARFNSEPARNKPLLSTMEMFRLKLGPDHSLPVRYAGADEATRRAMLAPGGEVANSVPNLLTASLWRVPLHIDTVEWFATTADLCRVMADLHRLEGLPGMEPLSRLLRINPGLQFDSASWRSVAYKGGSEPGVLNMTWLLERTDGRWFAVSFTWNDSKKEVDLKAASELAGAGVGLLSEVK